MTMTDDRRSAEIYQFPSPGPLRGRRTPRDDSKSVALSRLATTAIGGNWYHEEAIRDEARNRKS